MRKQQAILLCILLTMLALDCNLCDFNDPNIIEETAKLNELHWITEVYELQYNYDSTKLPWVENSCREDLKDAVDPHHWDDIHRLRLVESIVDTRGFNTQLYRCVPVRKITVSGTSAQITSKIRVAPKWYQSS